MLSPYLSIREPLAGLTRAYTGYPMAERLKFFWLKLRYRIKHLFVKPPSRLLAVADYKISQIPKGKKGKGLTNVGIDEFRIRHGSEPSQFPKGTTLRVSKGFMILLEPGIRPAVYYIPRKKRHLQIITDGQYDLSGRQRRFQFTNTTLQAMIGREVRYFTAATQAEPVMKHEWTFAVVAAATEDATNGNPVEDWAINKRWYVVSSSSHTNGGGGAKTVNKMELLNASLVAYAELTGLTINIPAGDTCDYEWTHSLYEGTGGGQTVAPQIMLGWLFQQVNPEITDPVRTVTVYLGAVLKLGPINVSYDPATGKADYSSTYTDWFADNVENNTGADFNYDTLWVAVMLVSHIAKIPVTPGTWPAGAKRRIDFKGTYADKP